MSKPVIFTNSAAWDAEASVWSGHCDDIPAAADAPTLNALLDKISVTALDLLPDNHPTMTPDQLFLRITASRKARHLMEWPDLMAAQALLLKTVWDNPQDEVWARH